MPFPLAIPVAISAVKALIRFRGQLDTILSLNEAAKGLPFRLPDAPPSAAQQLELERVMPVFFETDAGKVALALWGLAGAYESIRDTPAGQPPPNRAMADCLALYLEAADIPVTRIGPQDPGTLRQRASTGPSQEMRLAYFVVESQRLSRNSAVARVLLATADTLLEFVGENAGTFISNPRTRGVVETLIAEFTAGDDFDDDSAELIFRRLPGATASAVVAHPEIAPQTPALAALFRALSELKGDQGGQEFVARLLTLDGFESLVGSFVTHIAADPSFLVEGIEGEEVRTLAKNAIAATLREAGETFPALIDDPRALFGVLEAGIGAAADDVDGVLKTQLAGKPLLAAVFAAAAKSIGDQARNNALFKNLAAGSGFADLYAVALAAVAQNPAALQANKLDPFVAGLVASFADTLSKTPLAATISAATLRRLASQSLTSVAAHPSVLVRGDKYAASIVAAVFDAAAPLVAKGLVAADVPAVVDVALRAAAANLALADLDNARLRSILQTVGGALADAGVVKLATSAGARDALLAAVVALNANPAVWGKLDAADLLRATLDTVLAAIVADPAKLADPRKLLAGPDFARSLGVLLAGLARHGQQLAAGTATPAGVKMALTAALQAAEAELGRSLDGETLGPFLARVLTEALSASLGDDAADAEVAAVVAKALQWIGSR